MRFLDLSKESIIFASNLKRNNIAIRLLLICKGNNNYGK